MGEHVSSDIGEQGRTAHDVLAASKHEFRVNAIYLISRKLPGVINYYALAHPGNLMFSIRSHRELLTNTLYHSLPRYY